MEIESKQFLNNPKINKNIKSYNNLLGSFVGSCSVCDHGRDGRGHARIDSRGYNDIEFKGLRRTRRHIKKKRNTRKTIIINIQKQEMSRIIK